MDSGIAIRTLRKLESESPWKLNGIGCANVCQMVFGLDKESDPIHPVVRSSSTWSLFCERQGEEEGSRCYLSGFEVFHAASHLVSERDEILVGEDVARFHFMAGKLDGMFVRRISQLPY